MRSPDRWAGGPGGDESRSIDEDFVLSGDGHDVVGDVAAHCDPMGPASALEDHRLGRPPRVRSSAVVTDERADVGPTSVVGPKSNALFEDRLAGQERSLLDTAAHEANDLV